MTGLLEKKEDEKFALTAECLLGYLALHKHILAVLKVPTNVDTTVKSSIQSFQPESLRQ